MGLKFEHSDDLDKLFDSFAIDPKKKEMPIEELEKQVAKNDTKKEDEKKEK